MPQRSKRSRRGSKRTLHSDQKGELVDPVVPVMRSVLELFSSFLVAALHLSVSSSLLLSASHRDSRRSSGLIILGRGQQQSQNDAAAATRNGKSGETKLLIISRSQPGQERGSGCVRVWENPRSSLSSCFLSPFGGIFLCPLLASRCCCSCCA